ncbi:MAG: hypothetical protein BGN96_09455 [Bacteroidales bacterium 45-6]|nr:MAG: hypothetical protein BGN96_09455 [Bacteroidales bacterium 45-6]
MAIQLVQEEGGNDPRNQLLLAYAFLHAAHAANKSDWKQLAQDLLEETIDNQLEFSPKYANTKEFIQIMHLCSRIHQYIPEGKCQNHVELLLNEMLTPDAFAKLLQELISNGKFGIEDGIAGIGLVMVASIAEFEPSWDEAFFAF